jgi:uncharacterized protein (TIGR02001 family)
MKGKILIALFAALIGFGSVAHAEDLIKAKDLGLKVSANAGVVNEYFFRGLTQTNEKMAIQGGLDAAHSSGAYIGAWGSNVDFGDGDQASAEIDVYAGWSGEIAKSGVTADLGGIFYVYPGAADTLDYNYFEAYAGLSKDFGFASTAAKVSVSPDYFAGSGNATYVEGSIDIPLGPKLGKYLTLNLHGGYQWIDKNLIFGADDYFDWLVGVSFSVIGFDVQLAWVGTNLDNNTKNATSNCFRDNCSALLATVSKTF